ncbi:hypothetical protein [Microvirga roseola]|uniref:hypothetical protein n=1 Tax=Microvirga roseola TaxID=2883126 RepID=UPI001E410B24|nr:hypothetical protein [Microvirga roseola]
MAQSPSGSWRAATYAVGRGVVGVTGISWGVVGGTPTGSSGGGTVSGVVGGTPVGSGCGVSRGSGGRTGAGLGSPGVGSG